MKTARPSARTPLLLLASVGALALALGGLVLLWSALEWVLSYTDACAVAFAIIVSVWIVWVALAQLRRRGSTRTPR